MLRDSAGIDLPRESVPGAIMLLKFRHLLSGAADQYDFLNLWREIRLQISIYIDQVDFINKKLKEAVMVFDEGQQALCDIYKSNPKRCVDCSQA